LILGCKTDSNGWHPTGQEGSGTTAGKESAAAGESKMVAWHPFPLPERRCAHGAYH
jgi:hypothetical protein